MTIVAIKSIILCTYIVENTQNEEEIMRVKKRIFLITIIGISLALTSCNNKMNKETEIEISNVENEFVPTIYKENIDKWISHIGSGLKNNRTLDMNEDTIHQLSTVEICENLNGSIEFHDFWGYFAIDAMTWKSNDVCTEEQFQNILLGLNNVYGEYQVRKDVDYLNDVFVWRDNTDNLFISCWLENEKINIKWHKFTQETLSQIFDEDLGDYDKSIPEEFVGYFKFIGKPMYDLGLTDSDYEMATSVNEKESFKCTCVEIDGYISYFQIDEDSKRIERMSFFSYPYEDVNLNEIKNKFEIEFKEITADDLDYEIYEIGENCFGINVFPNNFDMLIEQRYLAGRERELEKFEEREKQQLKEKIKEKKEPQIGMTSDEIRKSTWGEPKDINKTTTKYGVHEQWVYGNGRYIYLDDGVVTAIQE